MKMAGTDLTHKKKKRRRDALAAHDILQSFLDAQP
jgi:RNase H-fold protein (predicted Holliday junction resolvase)